MSTISSPTVRFNGPSTSNGDSKSHLGFKLKAGSYIVVLLSGIAISNVSLANHPEWTPCCATATKAEIAKNLSNAAATAQKDSAEAVAKVIELKSAAVKNNK